MIELLQPIVDAVFREKGREPPQLERNLMQSMKGGYDIIGIEWMALEVKHQENLQPEEWWEQCVRQATDGQVPVLIYKQNRMKWRVRMFGYIPVGDRKVKCPVDIRAEAFMIYFAERLRLQIGE